MMLVDACENFFEFVCDQNRIAREGGVKDPATLEAELKAQLERVRTVCKRDPDLTAIYDEQVEQALVAFADSTIRTSRFPFAARWAGLGPARGWLNLDSEFFDRLLPAALAKRGDEAVERLTLFYTILGLGYQGVHGLDPPDQRNRTLRELMRQINARLGRTEDEEAQYIVPEAYQRVDKRTLHRSSNKLLVALVLLLIVMIPGLIIGNIMLYRSAQSELGESLARISAQQKPAQP